MSTRYDHTSGEQHYVLTRNVQVERGQKLRDDQGPVEVSLIQREPHLIIDTVTVPSAFGHPMLFSHHHVPDCPGNCMERRVGCRHPVRGDGIEVDGQEVVRIPQPPILFVGDQLSYNHEIR